MPPVVVIAGRQNVGKSSLFNALVGRRQAIVHQHAGVTRDRVGALAKFNGRVVELVDTGGLAAITEDELQPDVEKQARFAIASADLVLFVVDIRDGVTSGDREVAAIVRRRKGPTVLVANKSDNLPMDAQTGELFALGFGEPVAVSAAQRRNLDTLKERVLELVDAPEADAMGAPVRVSILGRRNVGKSTFVNTVAGEQRVIVSEKPGTTRDAVDVVLVRENLTVILTDTAGLRKRGKMDSPAELFGMMRAKASIERADAVVFMLDASDKVGALDRRIAEMIDEAKKPVAIVLNKWDLARGKAHPQDYVKYLGTTMPLLTWAPVICASAKEGFNAWATLELCARLVERSSQKFGTGPVNRVFRTIFESRPPPMLGTRAPKFYYAAQTGTRPVGFRVFVNRPTWFQPEYRRYVENRLRDALPVADVPIRLEFRGRRAPRKGRL